MREIKFRGKDSFSNEWRYGNLLIIDEKYHIVEKADISEDGHHFRQEGDRPTWIDEATVGQFTGVYDKNGKKIYEGDIVRASINFHGKERKIKYEVKFDDDIDNDSFGEPLTMGYCLFGYDFEVIGNIYENKDLMKEEKKND